MDGCCILSTTIYIQKITILSVSKLDGIILINHWYPTAVNAIWLPHSMDATVQMIKQKKSSKEAFLS
jgi:hypothetical protein